MCKFLLVPVTPRFDWRANFNIDVRSSYSLPQGMGLTSYVTIESILKELQLAHSNEKKLQTLAHELTKNSSGDYMMKVGLCVATALITTVLLLTQLRKIKELAQRKTNKAGPLAAGAISLPKYQSRMA